MDNPGSLLLAATQLYTLPDFTPVARFRPPHLSGAAVLSPDGQSLIGVTVSGFARVWRDNAVADLTAMSSYNPDPLIPAPDIPELLIPVLGESGYFRAGVRLPATTHVLAADVRLGSSRSAAPAEPVAADSHLARLDRLVIGPISPRAPATTSVRGSASRSGEP